MLAYSFNEGSEQGLNNTRASLNATGFTSDESNDSSTHFLSDLFTDDWSVIAARLDQLLANKYQHKLNALQHQLNVCKRENQCLRHRLADVEKISVVHSENVKLKLYVKALHRVIKRNSANNGVDGSLRLSCDEKPTSTICSHESVSQSVINEDKTEVEKCNPYIKSNGVNNTSVQTEHTQVRDTKWDVGSKPSTHFCVDKAVMTDLDFFSFPTIQKRAMLSEDRWMQADFVTDTLSSRLPETTSESPFLENARMCESYPVSKSQIGKNRKFADAMWLMTEGLDIEHTENHGFSGITVKSVRNRCSNRNCSCHCQKFQGHHVQATYADCPNAQEAKVARNNLAVGSERNLTKKQLFYSQSGYGEETQLSSMSSELRIDDECSEVTSNGESGFETSNGSAQFSIEKEEKALEIFARYFLKLFSVNN